MTWWRTLIVLGWAQSLFFLCVAYRTVAHPRVSIVMDFCFVCSALGSALVSERWND